MGTAKKQKISFKDEDDEINSWCTENEEGADLHLIVVNNEKKIKRVPIKSTIIEYSSGFVNDRPDRYCDELHVLGFEAIDVIRVLKYLMPLSEYSTSNMGSHALRNVIKTAKYLDVRALDHILRKEVYLYFETMGKIDFLTIWKFLKKKDKAYTLNGFMLLNVQNESLETSLHLLDWPGALDGKWNAMFNWDNYELLFDMLGTINDFECLFSRLKIEKSWNLIGLLIFFPTFLKLFNIKVSKKARMLKCLHVSYDLCKKIVQEPGSILTKRIYALMDLKYREVQLRYALGFREQQQANSYQNGGKVTTGFRDDANDLIGFISRDMGVYMFSYVDIMAKDNMSLIPDFFLQPRLDV